MDVNGIDVDVMLARGSSTRKHTNPTDTNDPPAVTMTTISGSFDGVSGTFECSNDCTGTDAVSFSQGRPVFVAPGNWTFTPTDKERSTVAIDNDEEYLWFGIWLAEPDVASQTHEFKFIFGGDDLNDMDADRLCLADRPSEV